MRRWWCEEEDVAGRALGLWPESGVRRSREAADANGNRNFVLAGALVCCG